MHAVNEQERRTPRLRGVTGVVWLLAACMVVGLYAANLRMGSLNQDEGWYLQAARLVAAGQWPYRDFFFTQGPVMPWVYGRLAWAWMPFGVAGGRALTAVLGLAGVVLAAVLAARIVPRDRRAPAALTVLALTGINVYHTYFTTIPKTYALTTLWVVSGLLCLVAMRGRRGRDRGLAAGAGILLSCAAGTRFSFALMPALTAFYLLHHRKRFGVSWLFFGGGGLVTLALFLVPLGQAGLPVLRFALGFHAARDGGRGVQALLLSAGSLSRLCQAYFSLLVLGLATLLLAGVPRRDPVRSVAAPAALPDPALLIVWMSVAVFAVHLFSPHPYDDYQVPLMPVFAALVAAAFWRMLPPLGTAALGGITAGGWTQAVVVALAAAQAFASPRVQDWVFIRQDRFWIQLKTEPDLVRLQRAGSWIRENSRPDESLLTQDLYLAVESRRPVPPGLDMGPFSFFPELPDAAADALHVVNAGRMARILTAAEAPLAAVSGYGFALDAPSMRPIDEQQRAEWLARLAKRYTHVWSIADFGQQHTELTLWKRTLDVEIGP